MGTTKTKRNTKAQGADTSPEADDNEHDEDEEELDHNGSFEDGQHIHDKTVEGGRFLVPVGAHGKKRWVNAHGKELDPKRNFEVKKKAGEEEEEDLGVS